MHVLVCLLLRSVLHNLCFYFISFYLFVLRPCGNPGEPSSFWFVVSVIEPSYWYVNSNMRMYCYCRCPCEPSRFFFKSLVISLRHFVNCLIFLVGIVVNPPALKSGTKKKKRAAHPNLHSARGEMTVSSAGCIVVRKGAPGKNGDRNIFTLGVEKITNDPPSKRE